MDHTSSQPQVSEQRAAPTSAALAQERRTLKAQKEWEWRHSRPETSWSVRDVQSGLDDIRTHDPDKYPPGGQERAIATFEAELERRKNEPPKPTPLLVQQVNESVPVGFGDDPAPATPPPVKRRVTTPARKRGDTPPRDIASLLARVKGGDKGWLRDSIQYHKDGDIDAAMLQEIVADLEKKYPATPKPPPVHIKREFAKLAREELATLTRYDFSEEDTAKMRRLYAAENDAIAAGQPRSEYAAARREMTAGRKDQRPAQTTRTERPAAPRIRPPHLKDAPRGLPNVHVRRG